MHALAVGIQLAEVVVGGGISLVGGATVIVRRELRIALDTIAELIQLADVDLGRAVALVGGDPIPVGSLLDIRGNAGAVLISKAERACRFRVAGSLRLE